MKRIFAAVVCAVMLAISLAGCSGGTGETGDAGNAGEVTTITIWSGDSHSQETMNRVIAEYNQTKGKESGIQIEYSVRDGDYGQVLDMALASDQGPDLFGMSNPVTNYAERGYIMPIEDLPGGAEYVQQYADLLVEDTHTYQGKTYKVPFYVVTTGLIYNKDMFRKYGIVDENGEPTPPTTFDEVREYAKIMTNPDEREYGIAIPLKSSGIVGTDIANLSLSSSGYKLFNPVTGQYEFEGVKPVLEMFMGIKEDGSYFPGAEGLEDDPARAQFAEGGIGMKFSGSYDVGVLNDQFPAKIDWGVAPYPVADPANRYRQRMASDGYLCINKANAEEKGLDKIMEVFEWFHGEDVLVELYKDCKSIPYDWSMVEDITLENPKTGWVEYCQMTEISSVEHRSVTADLTGKKDLATLFVEDLWTGEITVDEAVQTLNQAYNEGMQKTLEENPNISLEDYIDPDWNIRLDTGA